MRKDPHQNRADGCPPQRPGKPGDSSSTFSLYPTQSHKYLPRRSLNTSLCPNFCGCCPRDELLDLLALITDGAGINKSHRTITNKEAVINRHRITPPTPNQLYIQAKCRGSRQKHPSPSFFLEGLNYILSQLLSEGLASKQPASSC